jgi:hypothetical protein
MARRNRMNRALRFPVGLSTSLWALACAAASSRACLGQSPGSVVSWLGDFIRTDTPTNTGLVAKIAAGALNDFVIRHDGSAVGWGYPLLPTGGQAALPPGVDRVTAIACGAAHSMAVLPNGTVVCWGHATVTTDSLYQYGQASVPLGLPPAKDVAAGAVHSVAHLITGEVVCWGAGSVPSSPGGNGQNFGQSIVPAGLGTVAAISAGSNWTLALLHDGRATSWGNGGSSATGGTYFSSPAGAAAIRAIDAYHLHALGITVAGEVIAWGTNYYGECDVPPGLTDVRSVAAGETFSLALRNDGSLVAWGSMQGAPATVPVGLRAISKIGAGRHAIAELATDCNDNLVPDVAEISGHDCNENDIHDSCDAAVDLLEDCNSNGLGDSCEKQLAVALASGQLGPIGYQSGRTWTIPGAVRAQSAVTLRLTAHGDFGGLQEYVRVRAGPGFDELALRGTADCGLGPTACSATYTLSPEQFNAAITVGGELRISMEPSIAVDPAGCIDGTWIEATIDYVGARPADCNANGLLDGCEIAAGYSPDSNNNGVVDTCEGLILPCPSDFDQDGEVDGADLGILLGAWGVAGQPGIDLDSDGRISGADLGILLGDWGPCE